MCIGCLSFVCVYAQMQGCMHAGDDSRLCFLLLTACRPRAIKRLYDCPPSKTRQPFLLLVLLSYRRAYSAFSQRFPPSSAFPPQLGLRFCFRSASHREKGKTCSELPGPQPGFGPGDFAADYAPIEAHICTYTYQIVCVVSYQ